MKKRGDVDFDALALSPIRELVAGMPRSLNAADNLKNSLSPWHGTTIAVFIVENGKAAVAVSDGKVSEGELLHPTSLEFPKMVEVDDKTVMLFAGSAGFAVMYAKILKNWVETLERVREEHISTRAKVNMLSRILRESLPLAASGFPVGAILAVFDKRKGARTFIFVPDGSSIERKTYAISGSGRVGEALIADRLKRDMTRVEGVDLAKKLVKLVAKDLDSATGGRIFIKILDESGITTVDGGRANE